CLSQNKRGYQGRVGRRELRSMARKRKSPTVAFSERPSPRRPVQAPRGGAAGHEQARQGTAQPMLRGRGLRSGRLIWLALLTTFLVFYRGLEGGFVTWDDDKFVYENRNLQGQLNWTTVKTIFGPEGLTAAGYNPLTILTFAIEKELFNLDLQD